MKEQNSSTPQFGKGWRRRQEDPKKVRARWDKIKGFKKSKFK